MIPDRLGARAQGVRAALQANRPGRRFARMLAAMLVASACQRSAQQPLELVPQAAQLVAHVRPNRFAQPPWPTLAQRIVATEPLAVEIIDALDRCQLDPSTWTELALGVDADRHLVLAIDGPGVGDLTRWRCVVESMRVNRADASTPTERSNLDVRMLDASTLELRSDGTPAFGHRVTANLVAWTDSAWRPVVAELSQRRGQPLAIDTLSTSLTADDRRAPLWMAGRVPPAGDELAGAPAADGAQSLAVVLELHEGAKLRLAVAFDSPAHASAAASELRTALFAARPAAKALGLPESVLDAIRVQASGTEFRLDATLSAPDLSALTGSSDPRVPTR